MSSGDHQSATGNSSALPLQLHRSLSTGVPVSILVSSNQFFPSTCILLKDCFLPDTCPLRYSLHWPMAFHELVPVWPLVKHLCTIKTSHSACFIESFPLKRGLCSLTFLQICSSQIASLFFLDWLTHLPKPIFMTTSWTYYLEHQVCLSSNYFSLAEVKCHIF